MRTLPGKRALGVTAALGLALAAAVVAAPADADGSSTGTTASTGCVALDQLTSQQVTFDYHDLPPAGTSVGDYATFHDNVLDANGAVIGTRDGTATIAWADPSTGHLIAVYDATFTFGDGSVESAGTIDTVAANSGTPTTISGFGLSGRYLGLTGTVTNQKTSPTVDSVHVDLC
ncbi:allene oxide cyclase barrel-like domain-containing protein [Kitasatospora sp. LaBMicrA B282]|uniref:allene oxide cyclase barrel-like domain-containing protein n=1 Tax=Kitasatospora sp. LaBMicrA B282 TaxID=3420949 RepID=UPI003D0A9E1C